MFEICRRTAEDHSVVFFYPLAADHSAAGRLSSPALEGNCRGHLTTSEKLEALDWVAVNSGAGVVHSP